MQSLSKQDRKRAQDRAAQRASRTRTKDRLARLELQIAQLQGGADQALLEEVNRLRHERSQLRTLADQLLNIAGAVDATLVPMDDGLGVSSRQSVHPRTNLLSNIVQDYEALKSTQPTPLTDPHPILVGILNGWNTPVADQEKPVQRLMANLHRSLMLERPLVRPIDQLAILYLAQMSLLVLLAQHEACRAYLSQIPGWLYPIPAQTSIAHNVTIDMIPWPQLRMHLLSQPDVVNYDTQPCNDFAMAILRNLFFVPKINFEDAYIVDSGHRLTLSPRFSQLFSPGAPMPPFSVSPSFADQYPALRELVPEWHAHDHVYQLHRSRPEGSQNLIALPSQSHLSGSSAGDDQQRLDRASSGLLEGEPFVNATQNVSTGAHSEMAASQVGGLSLISSMSVPAASPRHSMRGLEPIGNWDEAFSSLAETDSIPAWLLDPAGEGLDNL
ncbi:hypothetical protein BDW72DRAFT_188059 [Aspergillus terricola var. indicus]